MQMRAMFLGLAVLALGATSASAQEAMAKDKMAKGAMDSDHMASDHMASSGAMSKHDERALIACKAMKPDAAARSATCHKLMASHTAAGPMGDGMKKDDAMMAKH